MKKILTVIFSLSLFFALGFNSQAEIVQTQKEEKKFGEWKSFCEIDVMMDVAHCNIGTKFFDDASSITIEPNKKSFNQILIVIPKIKNGNFLQIRIDKNDMILPRPVDAKDFGLIALDQTQKQVLFAQMLKGEFLFLRFETNDSNKEITAKINLSDFRNALSYYRQRTSQ